MSTSFRIPSIPAPPPPLSSSTQYNVSRPHQPQPQTLPLESNKSVLQFQRRHAEEFAHLHTDADAHLLAIERARLEEERRKGREKRQSRQGQIGGTRSLSVDNSYSGSVGGTRPLSLLKKREIGHTRSRTEDAGTGLGLGIGTINNKHGYGFGSRRNSLNSNASSSLRPLTLRSSLVSPPPSAGLLDRQGQSQLSRQSGGGNGLEVLVEREGSPPLESSSSEANTSFTTNQSTYSWATSFSGETTELRTAAHYVPPTPTSSSGEGEGRAVDEADVDLDSPARKAQRRKRIVAIAHTVRQLEGVGSRDLEDPNFYHVLQKAWYARFDEKDRPQQATQPLRAAPPAVDQQMSTRPYDESPPLLSSTPYMSHSAEAGPSSYVPTGMEYAASPPDPEFQTPQDGFQPTFGGYAHHVYPRPESTKTYGSSMRSNSVRYSYASTLHDLALDGGLNQGNRLMQEKAWLRPSSYVGTPWGGDFMAPPNFRAITPEEPEPDEDEEEEEQSVGDGSRGPYELGPPPLKTLRRIDGNVSRPVQEQAPSPQAEIAKLPEQGEAGPSRWGLGLGNAWWGNSSGSKRSTSLSTKDNVVEEEADEDAEIPASLANDEDEVDEDIVEDHSDLDIDQDFHLGENGNIPHAQQTGSQILLPWMEILRPSSAVLEPDHIAPMQIKSHCVKIRRHSYPSPRALRVNSRPEKESHSRGRRRSEPRESAYWNRYRPIFTWTHSIISSDRRPGGPSAVDQQQQPNQKQDPVEKKPVQVLEGEEKAGLTGSERSSHPSRWTRGPHSSSPLDKPLSDYPPYQPQSPATVPASAAIARPLQSAWHERTAQDEWEAGLAVPRAPLVQPSSIYPQPIDIALPAPPAWPAPVHLSPLAPRPAIPIRTTSRPRDYASSSYPPWSSDIASAAGAATVAVGPSVAGVRVTDRQYVRDGLPHGIVSSRPELRDAYPGRNDAIVRMDLSIKHRPNHPHLSRAMFFLGFLMPLLWLVGGWPTSTSRKRGEMGDLEQGTHSHTHGPATRTARRTKVDVENMPWWRKWTYNPDPYVERCRWAAGVTVPVCVVGGVTAATLLGVLR